jgi:hypothetical protein
MPEPNGARDQLAPPSFTAFGLCAAPRRLSESCCWMLLCKFGAYKTTGLGIVKAVTVAIIFANTAAWLVSHEDTLHVKLAAY